MEEFAATLIRGFSQFQGEIALLPAPVLAWMWAMRIVFGFSLVFLPRRGAAAVLAVMIATALARFYFKGLYPDIPAPLIGAQCHIVLWAPLLGFLLYAMRGQRARRTTFMDKAYAVWYLLVTAVLAISLVFDVREILTAMVGSTV